jgi:hypothetical protein
VYRICTCTSRKTASLRESSPKIYSSGCLSIIIKSECFTGAAVAANLSVCIPYSNDSAIQIILCDAAKLKLFCSADFSVFGRNYVS